MSIHPSNLLSPSQPNHQMDPTIIPTSKSGSPSSIIHPIPIPTLSLPPPRQQSSQCVRTRMARANKRETHNNNTTTTSLSRQATSPNNLLFPSPLRPGQSTGLI